jgi:hypothetical protein
LHHGEAVQIGVDDDVRDVAVHEDLAGLQGGDLVCGHARIRAADPQVVGRLDACEVAEKFRVAAFDLVGLRAVVCEQVVQVGHVAHVLRGTAVRLQQRARAHPIFPASIAPRILHRIPAWELTTPSTGLP